MSKNKHGPSEKVMFNGYSYRRYPESPRRELRVYFARSGRQRVNWLHRDIWIHHNGPIPAGFHVHHVDGNPLNNAIENLAVMPEREHHQRALDGRETPMGPRQHSPCAECRQGVARITRGSRMAFCTCKTPRRTATTCHFAVLGLFGAI
jgi:hypothetical protein